MSRADVGPLTSVPEIRYINQHRVHPFPRVARFLEHAPRNLELYIYIYLLARPVSRLYAGSREKTWKTCRHPTWLEIGTSALRLFRDRITDQFPVRARDEECSVGARFHRALLRSPLKGPGRSREGARNNTLRKMLYLLGCRRGDLARDQRHLPVVRPTEVLTSIFLAAAATLRFLRRSSDRDVPASLSAFASYGANVEILPSPWDPRRDPAELLSRPRRAPAVHRMKTEVRTMVLPIVRDRGIVFKILTPDTTPDRL